MRETRENRNYHLSAGTSDEDTAGAQSPRTETRDDTAESKSAYPMKETDIKATTEAKKKPVVDFKVKSDQKYQKPIVKDDDAKRPVDVDASTTLSTSSTTSPTKSDHFSATTKPMDAASVTSPFLLHGEPMAGITATVPTSPTVQDTTSRTEQMRTTEETASSRGRALNISAPEPTNSLHANITDLSDVSMDEDDKEVEGKRCVAKGTLRTSSPFFSETLTFFSSRYKFRVIRKKRETVENVLLDVFISFKINRYFSTFYG